MNFNHLFDDKELRLANKNSKCAQLSLAASIRRASKCSQKHSSSNVL
jgi:hypothetical protein